MASRAVPSAFAAAMVAAAFAGVASACGATTNDASPDAAPIDVAGDSGTVDSATDGESDGATADAGSSDSGHFCTTLPASHDFCEDFEEPLYFGSTRWTRPNVFGFGRLHVENGALVSEILENDSGTAYHPAALVIERNWKVPLEKDTRRLALSYRMKIERCNAIIPVSFFGGVDRDEYYSYSAYIEVRQEIDCTARVAGFYVEADGGAIAYFQPGATIPISVGTVVDYAITLQEIAGTTTFALTARGITSSASFPAIARGDIVTVFVGGARPWVLGTPERLDFDDILFDYGR